MKYTIEQRVRIISLYYQNDGSARKTYHALRTVFKQTERPSEQTIYRLVKKFETTGSVVDIKPSVRARSGRSPRNIAAVNESVLNDPTMSIPRRSKLLGISQTTLCRILTEDLGLRAASNVKEINGECTEYTPEQQPHTELDIENEERLQVTHSEKDNSV